ncbi:hypothetical protein [Caproiciproducens sp. LBM24188]
MNYSGIITMLILLLYFAKIEYENKGIKWGNSLDYAVLGSLIIVALELGFEIWRTFKDRNDSQSEHTRIQDNDDKNRDLLIKDHERLSDKIDASQTLIREGQGRISQTTSEIHAAVSSIDKQLAVEEARREELINSMTSNQRNLHDQINAIYALNEQLPILQLEKQQITEKYEALLKEHKDLEHNYLILQMERDELQKKYEYLLQGFEQEETENFTQKIE